MFNVLAQLAPTGQHQGPKPLTAMIPESAKRHIENAARNNVELTIEQANGIKQRGFSKASQRGIGLSPAVKHLCAMEFLDYFKERVAKFHDAMMSIVSSDDSLCTHEAEVIKLADALIKPFLGRIVASAPELNTGPISREERDILSVYRKMRDDFEREVSMAIKRNQKEKVMTQNYTFTNAQITASQFGNYNSQQIESLFREVIQKIEASNATPEEKKEAKSRLAKFLEHPLVAAVVAGSAVELLSLLASG